VRLEMAVLPHPKHLNTPRLVADATGTTVWRWDQAEPFGNNPAEEDPDANSVSFDLPLRLPGQRYDQETGLHYNYFRDYDPSLGRYGESDPIGLRGGRNTYAYVLGDPIARIDPRGLKARLCCKKVPWLPAAHCFVHEVSDSSCCGSKTRRLGLQGPYPWGSSKYKDLGEIHEDDGFDQPDESQCGEWNTDCAVHKCIAAREAEYPNPSKYNAILGPNSNTFAATIANACALPLPWIAWPPVGWPDDPHRHSDY